jgi:hypothetical protein
MACAIVFKIRKKNRSIVMKTHHIASLPIYQSQIITFLRTEASFFSLGSGTGLVCWWSSVNKWELTPIDSTLTGHLAHSHAQAQIQILFHIPLLMASNPRNLILCNSVSSTHLWILLSTSAIIFGILFF